MTSINEWDPVTRVIVGSATNAQIPAIDASLRCINYADRVDISDIPVGQYPSVVIEQANEDLEIFCDFLRSEHIEVLRPTQTHTDYYNFCPRDGILVHGKDIVVTPQPLRCRAQEYHAFTSHLPYYTVVNIARSSDLYNFDCVGNRDVLALTEVEPAFDAANILRCNNDLFYLVSNSANEMGLKWLQEFVGESKRVWPIRGVYSYMHIDSTIALLREGLMLLNPSRIKSLDQLPKPLQNWDVIWAPEPEDIGYHPGYCHGSVWVANVNLFSLRPDLVVLEQHQHATRVLLEKHGIDCAMLPGRHQRTLSGGFHCVTLDISRTS